MASMRTAGTLPRPGLWRRLLGILRYRGHEGQWSWMLHRAAGLGIILFLYLHIFDIWLIGLGEETFNDFLFLYSHPVFKVFETFLIFGVLFHAVNGARIILVDLVPGMTRHQRKLVYIETAIMLTVLVPTVWVTLESLFR
ncbi:MAG: succinate dehydrogenase, cytochrome b556 subunit [Ardenticatenales bacterium]|nr:succinate dehydrogenase, cytochrome b556 subunit [Ardenticatenales bacterium]